MTELITCQINPVAVFEDNEEEVAAGDIPHHEDLPQPGHVEPGVAAAPAAAAEAAAEVRDVAVPAEAAAAEDVPWDVLFPKKKPFQGGDCYICTASFATSSQEPRKPAEIKQGSRGPSSRFLRKGRKHVLGKV